MTSSDKNEDILFLKDQMGARKMTLGPVDRRYLALNKTKTNKKVISKPRESTPLSLPVPMEQISFSSDSSDPNESEASSEEGQSSSQLQTITLSREAIETTMRTALSLDISSYKMTAALLKFITAAGGDIKHLPLSYKTSCRMKEKVQCKDSRALKTLLINDIKKNDRRVQIPFDGKLIQVVIFIAGRHA